MRYAWLLLIAIFFTAAHADFSAVVGGRAVEEEDPVAKSTVQVKAAGRVCSGTLIAEDFVVTNAHCLSHRPPASGVRVLFGAESGSGGSVVAASYSLHPSYREGGINRATGSFDLALVHLSEAAPDGYSPAPMMIDSAKLRPGQSVVVAGFGRTSPEDRASAGTLRRAATRLLKHYNATEIILSSSPGGTCTGDSGGPSFVFADGRYYLLGVVVGGDADCVIDERHIRIGAFQPWLSQEMNGHRDN